MKVSGALLLHLCVMTVSASRVLVKSQLHNPLSAKPVKLAGLVELEAQTLCGTLQDPGFHLAPGGSFQCDFGTPATEAQCNELVKGFATAAKKTPGRPLQVGAGGKCNDGGWGSVPLGCSTQSDGDWAAHFKKSGTSKAGCTNKAYQLVCTGAPPAPPAPAAKTIEILKGKLKDCDESLQKYK